MKRKYTDEDYEMPKGKLIEVPDFLPPPHKLIFPQDVTVKITLTLTKTSVDFFKREAKKNHTKYQVMLRKVIDLYAHKF